MAVCACVPLMNEMPSLASSWSGESPSSCRAAAARCRTGAVRPRTGCRTSTSPSPSSASAMWESGARSPQAPTLPCSGTTGWMPAFSSATSPSAIAGRTPLVSRSSTLARSSMAARTTSSGSGRPHARRVAAHEVALEVAHLMGGDAHVGQLPEAGVHAVDGAPLGHGALDDGAAPQGALRGLGGDRDGGEIAGNGGDGVERERATVEQNGFHAYKLDAESWRRQGQTPRRRVA
jgi:hypothetical protein